jgi:hypothetical protein
MEVIRDPDETWFKMQSLGDPKDGKGIYGLWSEGNLDGWVGKDGPLVRDWLGGVPGGRVKTLSGVPHAFCLSEWASSFVVAATNP